MTQTQYIESEVFKFLRFQFPEKKQLEVLEIFNHKIEYSLNEEGNEILIAGAGLNHVMGWSDNNGIYSLIDEDREFDEKFQEAEA